MDTATHRTQLLHRGSSATRTGSWLLGFFLLAIGIAPVLAACGDGDSSTTTPATARAATNGAGSESTERTVASILAGDERFGTLLRVLDAAVVRVGPPGSATVTGSAAENMDEAGWDHTLFAPTDDAFDSLDEDSVAAFLSDAGAATEFVRRHVVPRLVTSANLEAGEIQAIAGSVEVSVEGDLIRYGGAQVIQADIRAGNGIIHVIDAVVSP